MKQKSILHTGLALLLALGLTACGSTANNTNNASDNTAPAADSDTEADADTRTAEGTGDRLDEVLERGYLIVGTEGTYSPVSYHDEDDNLVGFDVEVAAGIAKHMGVEVQYLETSWDSIFAALDAGQIDTVINEVGYNEDRARKYDFTEPYAFARRCVLVKGDNGDITSFEDLEGKICANEATSIFGEMAEQYGASLDPVGAMAQSISEVLNGRADATLNYETSFNDYMKEHPEEDVKIAVYGEPEPSSYVPVVKGNERLLEAIQNALDEMRESGELKEISEKYFNGVDITAAE